LGAQSCLRTIIENLDLEKPSFRPSKWPRKLKPAKNSKLPKWPENCFEPFGKGGWPPISTWINYSSSVVGNLYGNSPVTLKSKLGVLPQPLVSLLVVFLVFALLQMILQIWAVPFILCDRLLDLLYACSLVEISRLWCSQIFSGSLCFNLACMQQ
jgi:hypothetical protein